MDDPNPGEVFALFNEIGIIEQLSRAQLEARLPDGLIAPHFTVLNHLVRVRDGTTPLRMARAFQVPKTSMTHTLKGLEARGLIEMRPNPEDGRSKTVWLTAAGRKLREDTIGKLAVAFQSILQDVDLPALLQARPALTELRIAMDKARDGPDPKG
jgi:DNA-binding MarR family transcriptional regulator